MPEILLTIGASCSGKTTWAEDFVIDQYVKDIKVVNLNRDDVRFHLFTNGVRYRAKYKFNKSNEQRVTDVIDQQAFDAALKGESIIISDTNLNPKTRSKWLDFANEHNYTYREKLFPCDWNSLVKRNAQREGGISESLLFDQYKRYMQQFGGIKLYKEDLSLPDTVVVDIDGTIADMQGVRKPFDWDKVIYDIPRYEIITMVEALGNKTNHVTFLSGRDGVCYKDTMRWIKDNVKDEEFIWSLYMRSPNDNRKDDIIKDELYEQHIRDKYNVVAVVDDRPQMIRHWTVKNMPNIVNVGHYNKEF